MPDEIYEIIALAARYWFLFLMILIAWRSYRWYTRDRKKNKKRLRLLPDAGYIGELVVMQGDDIVTKGTCLPIGREGVLGYLRGSDVCVPIDGVANRHLWFSFDDADGLRVEPFRGRMIVADGEELIGHFKHAFLSHGSLLQVGQAKLRLRMFSGFEYAGETAAQRMAFADAPEESPVADALEGRPPADATRRMHEIAAWQTLQEEEPPQGTGAYETFDAASYSTPAAQESEPQFYPPDMSDAEDDEPPYIPPADDPAYYTYDTQENPPVFYPPVLDDDEAEPAQADGSYPKSAYVGEDEAARAKRVLWDKYLKGGSRR